ncbi:efflux RND transporter permease subunit [Synergistes jonesii]|uniref:efflux RND transporter permease subunit n=1 Tax=Synergistes jonesii TaxID=2754 RepID=UPI00248EFC2B|nr:efflux RND transporter permease subunit [Synergistes jonesii]
MLSKFLIEHPRLATVISVIMMIAGVISAKNLAVAQYPNIAPPEIYVMATYPGADAETIAATVGVPLEKAINGVDGMTNMTSSSNNTGSYSLTISFETGANPDMALIKVQNRVQQAASQLPQEVSANGITSEISFSGSLGYFALISPKRTRDELFLNEYAISDVANRLKRVPGIGKIEVYGSTYSVRVWLNPERLASMGLSASDVANAISSQNKQASVGAIGGAPSAKNSSLVYSLAAKGRLRSVKEFEDVIVRTTQDGGRVKLRDVARVELGSEAYNNISTVGSAPAAIISLSQAAGSNALDVMREAKKAIKEMEPSLPEDTAFVTVYDSTEMVVETIREIMMTLILTFVLVASVCYIFLQNWKVTLIPVVAIPVSILATFTGLLAFGYSINTLTLFALILVIGTVVDDAIIVVERVMFIMERDGKNSFAATYQAMKDVTGPMTATTLVFLAMFAPVMFMKGMTGEIYRQFALTISFAVVFSLAVALTLSPVMCAYILSKEQPEPGELLKRFSKLLDSSREIYVKVSAAIAGRTSATLFLLAAVAAACCVIASVIPSSFIPDEDQGMIEVSVKLPENTAINRTKTVVCKLADMVRTIPGVRETMNIAGFDTMEGDGENLASLSVILDHWSKRKGRDRSVDAVAERINELASKVPWAQVNTFVSSAVSGVGKAGGISFYLQAADDTDMKKLTPVVSEFIKKLNASPEIDSAFTTYSANTPHLFLDIDREKAEMLGVPVGNVFNTLQSYFGGSYVNDVNIGAQSSKVILQSEWRFRSKMDDVGQVNVAAGDTEIPLKSFTTLKKVLMPRVVDRYNLYPGAYINASVVHGYSTGQAMERAMKTVKELPPGYKLEWSGMTYQEQKAGGQIARVFCIALLFGYLFLVAQYESWAVPLAVMLSLPVAFLGALSGIMLMHTSMSIYSQLGILVLAGLAAKNAILIIEFAQEQHEVHGVPILESAENAAHERYRAVLMTAFTCVFGVLPMLFASGAGAISRIHVGTTMCFGMAISTVFGIFIIPGLYVVLQGVREKIKNYTGLKFDNPDWQENHDKV